MEESKEKDSICISVFDRKNVLHELEVPLGISMKLMEVLKSYEFPIKATCGGMALCSTCHSYIESDHELNDMTEDEENMLDQAFFVKDNSRLTCQIPVTENLDGLVIRIAPDDEEI